MANELRDHVWFIDTSATLANDPPSEQRLHTIRWLSGSDPSTIIIDRILPDGTFETVWEDQDAGDVGLHPYFESWLDVRTTLGFRITLTGTGTQAYLYQALDNFN